MQKASLFEWNKHKVAKYKLHDIMNSFGEFSIIHYACYGFDGNGSYSGVRITSIAILHCTSQYSTSTPGQREITVFDLVSAADELRIPRDKINDKIDKVEKSLLKNFYNHIASRQDRLYLHWNMQDNKYGFQAINNRYFTLTNKQPMFTIPPDHQVNISDLLGDYYGYNYVEDPKIEHLYKLNPNLASKDLLLGKDEAKSFEVGNYTAIRNSNIAKVKFFHEVLMSVYAGKLKVSKGRLKAFKLFPQVLFEIASEKWWFWLLTLFVGAILGVIIGKI